MSSREYHRSYYYLRRQRLLDYLGNKCAECSGIDNLQFDHINPAQKSFDIKSNLSINNKEVKAELDKCQLLCKSCHAKKTAKENSGFTHGTLYGWQKAKCCCKDCLKAKRIWHDKRNTERRKV